MALHRRHVTLVGLLSAAALAVGATVATATPQVMTMTTPLNTAEEVPEPDVDTNPRGVAVIKLGNDGELTYRLNVANIENVLMAHIHLGQPGETGGVVVWLHGDGAPELIEGRFSGTLATGTITDDDLVGALAGQTVEDLLDEIRDGNAYVNVHTTRNMAGEIRGQIPGDRGPGSR